VSHCGLAVPSIAQQATKEATLNSPTKWLCPVLFACRFPSLEREGDIEAEGSLLAKSLSMKQATKMGFARPPNELITSSRGRNPSSIALFKPELPRKKKTSLHGHGTYRSKNHDVTKTFWTATIQGSIDL